MNEEVLVPIFLFLTTGAAIIAFLIYRYRNYLAAQETLKKLIDSEQPLSPELIQSIGIKKPPAPFADLRRGVLLVAFGVATALFGQFIPEEEANQVFLGLAAFPIFLGIGFFIAHYLGKRES